MTVRELMIKLSQMPEDAVVFINSDESDAEATEVDNFTRTEMLSVSPYDEFPNTCYPVCCYRYDAVDYLKRHPECENIICIF